MFITFLFAWNGRHPLRYTDFLTYFCQLFSWCKTLRLLPECSLLFGPTLSYLFYNSCFIVFRRVTSIVYSSLRRFELVTRVLFTPKFMPGDGVICVCVLSCILYNPEVYLHVYKLVYLEMIVCYPFLCWVTTSELNTSQNKISIYTKKIDFEGYHTSVCEHRVRVPSFKINNWKF